MRLSRVAVVGGGPGGLYAARLLKLARPECEVVVHEQSVPGDTFGFGVGLAARTRRRLATADLDTLREIEQDTRQHGMRMRVRGRTVDVASRAQIGIARPRLLEILHRYAVAVGVDVRFGERVEAAAIDADLVIAADGVSSATRNAEPAFGGSIGLGKGLYLWAATDFALPTSLFEPVTTEHGVFVTHAYPYQADRSTFLIETDEETLRRAGLDTPGENDSSTGTDERSLRYLETVFADALHGHRLIGNRTRWSRFRTVRAERWHHGRTVLLGDAAHTAHYSVGSGTKLAMEDAIELVRVLGDAEDLDGALRRYEAIRRPEVERLQDIAHRSLLWWESFPERLDLPVAQLLTSYMSRAGNVPLVRFARSNPDVVRRALRDFTGGDVAEDAVAPEQLNRWVLNQPLEHPGATAPQRRLRERGSMTDGSALTAVEQCPGDPWSPLADALVERCAAQTAHGFHLFGPSDRGAVLDRLELAERLRRRTGAPVAASVPAELEDDAVAGLVCGRIDLVHLEPAGPRGTADVAFVGAPPADPAGITR